MKLSKQLHWVQTATGDVKQFSFWSVACWVARASAETWFDKLSLSISNTTAWKLNHHWFNLWDAYKHIVWKIHSVFGNTEIPSYFESYPGSSGLVSCSVFSYTMFDLRFYKVHWTLFPPSTPLYAGGTKTLIYEGLFLQLFILSLAKTLFDNVLSWNVNRIVWTLLRPWNSLKKTLVNINLM